MRYSNSIKFLILGILLGALLLAGGMAFHALEMMLKRVQISYTEQGLLVKL